MPASALRALIALAAAADAFSPAAQTKPRHLVLIVADDLGYADLGYTGSEIRTPNIDGLANNGVKLGSFYVQRACSPTRAALLTGRYNIRYGFQSGVLTDHNNYSLPLDETLLPQFVRRTRAAKAHAVGKWHLGYHQWEHTPTYRGFDTYLGYYSGDADYFTHQGSCGGYDLHLAERPNCGANCSRPMWEAQGVYSTHLFTGRAVSLIEAHDPRLSLLLYLPYQAVHVPDQVPPQYKLPYHFPRVLGTDARNDFAGMLACLDEGVGNVTSALRRSGLLDETLIWFQTDNGAATPACGGWTGGQNWPLRGGKCTAWEGGLRGTAFVWGAGILPSLRGTTTTALMHTVDVLPTLVEAMGGDPNGLAAPGYALDGVSHWAMLSGATKTRDTTRDTTRDATRDATRALTSGTSRAILLECDPYASPWSNRPPSFVCGGDQHATPYYALRQGRWKLLLGDPGADDNLHPSIGNGFFCTGPPCPPTHNNSATLAGPWSVDSVMLFDLEADPTESNNVAAAHQDVVRRLTVLVQQFNASAVDSSGVCAPSEPGQAPAKHNGTCTPWLS